jgi:beta-propeller repeat-containing protein
MSRPKLVRDEAHFRDRVVRCFAERPHWLAAGIDWRFWVIDGSPNGFLNTIPHAVATHESEVPMSEHAFIPSRSMLVLLTFLFGFAFPGAAAAEARASQTYGQLKLHFEANRGQTHDDVRFLARGPGYSLYLTAGEAVLALAGSNPVVLRMAIVDADPKPLVSGLEELPGKANYFIGNDPSKWRTNVPTYAKVHYRSVYPGIDLVYYGNQRQLEYDFVVAPGADPKRIVLGFEGADKLEIGPQGDLALHAGGGVLRQRKPFVYQEIDGQRQEIDGTYVLKGANRVGFQVAAYDVKRPLVIDPVLFYSTYLGGSGSDFGLGIAVDTSGNAYVTGLTTSANFPTLGAFQPTIVGPSDAFVTKLNPTGSGLVYSTYLGGSADDQGIGVAVDTSGNAYVTGHTFSSNFPFTTGAFQTSFGGGTLDAWIAKLSASGSVLLYSTYLGGSAEEFGGQAIAVDSAGTMYVTGATRSTNFPTTVGAFQTTRHGAQDAFVTKLNPGGSGAADLVYSTYLGGNDAASTFPEGGFGIAVDVFGRIYVAGRTGSTDFPTSIGAFQTALKGREDAFVTKLNPAGGGAADLVYSTYLGGSGIDHASCGGGPGALALDPSGAAYVTGLTDSVDFPTTNGAFQPSYQGGTFDAWVAKLDPLGVSLMYSTYLGGSGEDRGCGIAVDPMNNAYVSGHTASTDFPTLNAIQSAFAGVQDAFVTKINPTGTALIYSTYLGGTGDDVGFGIALDALPNPNAYVSGFTASTDFPTTAGAFQTSNAGSYDAFVAKITDVVLPPPPTVGKVTGGGSIDVVNGIGTFGFIVQRQAVDASVHGQLQYVNHASADKVHSVEFTAFAIAGNTATFGGLCTNNGAPCTFTVNVTDSDEPGFDDTFTISVSAGPTEGGTLRSGNIQIHD